MNTGFFLYIPNSIGYFELSDKDIKQLSDHSGLLVVNIFGEKVSLEDYLVYYLSVF